MTLEEIRRAAAKDPTHCAVCRRTLRPSPRGGRRGFLCPKAIRKACRRAYQAAYRAALNPRRLRLILSVEPHPKLLGICLVKLECGHTRDMPAGDTQAGRKKTHCPRCSPPPRARVRR